MIPFFDMAAELAPLRAEIDAAIARVLDSGIFIGGPEVIAFECALAATTGAAHCVGTSSGTDALHALALAIDLQPGDEVITTPLTFFATAGAFARLGARIVFADIDDDTLTLDPRATLTAVSSRTRAIVPVHLFGLLAALPTAPCPILEDAAQSLGAGPPRGLAAAVSFFPTKNLGALGDAGAILTDDAALADRLMLLRTQGARPKYHHLAIGGNFRLDAIQAAILHTKLPHLARWTAARRAHATAYRSMLGDLPLHLPPDHPTHVYHQFVIRTPKRDALQRHLAALGTQTEIYYPSPLHLQPALAHLGYAAGSFPITERACAEVLALPIHPALSVDARTRVAEQIAAFFRTA